MTTVWDGHQVLGFMAETYLNDLKVVGFKAFQSNVVVSKYLGLQQLGSNHIGLPTYHLTQDQSRDKDALVSQSPIVVFKVATVLQSLGIVSSRIILPSSDVKGEKKNKTYCPSTFEMAYQYHSPSEYSDMLREARASSLLSVNVF